MAESAIQRGRMEKLAAEAFILRGTAFDDGGIIHTSGLEEETIGESVGALMLAELSPQTAVMAAETCDTNAHRGSIFAEARDDGVNADEGIVSGGGVVAQRTEEVDAVSIEGNVMSIDGSSSEGSTDHSTCGSSVSASELRKRVADASPDREREESSRRDFPGRVTRSAAGCRVYIPPITSEGDDCP